MMEIVQSRSNAVSPPVIYEVQATQDILAHSMDSDKTPGGFKLRRVFPSVPPKRITQEAFDISQKHLSRLARLRPVDRAEAGDLSEYTRDLLYAGEIQGLYSHTFSLGSVAR